MKKTIIPILLISIFLITSYATAGGPKWKEFSSPEGHFSVLMPGKPEFKKKTDKTLIGNIGENIYTCKTKKITVTAEYTDLPGIAVFFGGRNGIYKKSKNAFLKSTKGKEISFKPFKQKGYAGKELVYKTPTRFGKVRFLLVNKRLYVLQASSTSGKSDEKNIDKYLESFKQSYKKPHKKIRRKNPHNSWKG